MPGTTRTRPTAAALVSALSLLAAASVAAGPSDSALADLEARQLGLSISGKARSQFLRAALSGDSARIGQPTVDNSAFSQADIELAGRPSAATRGRLLFRVHQDWQSHYDEGPNPLIGRWFDFSGSAMDGKVSFAVGDFLAKRSPLVLHSAEPELLYEPEIFADRRRTAMDDWFLGENRLPLQGLDASFRKELSPSVHLEAGASAARLRTVFTGPTTWFFWTDDVEKVMGRADAGARLLGAIDVGFDHVSVIDDKAASRARNNAIEMGRRGNLPRPLYEDVSVNAFRGGIDAGRWLGGNLTLAVDGEFALSGYRAARDERDTTQADGIRMAEVEKLDGTAMRAALQAGYGKSEGPISVSLGLNYRNNDKDFVNDLAQTPAFRGRRILNSLNDVGGHGGGYSTLDALYNQQYTVDPVTNITSSEYWYSDTKSYNGTNNWLRVPFAKSSWSNSVTTKAERDALAGSGDPSASALDPHVQLLFPFGPATANRTGIDADLSATLLSGVLEARVLFAALNEVEGAAMDSLLPPAASYGRMGGGVSADLGKLMGLSRRLAFSGSYVGETRDRDAFSSKGVSVGAENFATSLINAGVYAAIWKGLSVLAGYQKIASNPVLGYAVAGSARSPTVGDLVQSQWAAGLELRLGAGAYLTAEYGILAIEQSAATARTSFTQDISSVAFLLAF